jgi:two-component system cell cycle sensor histidine kinase/response regulator CckA
LLNELEQLRQQINCLEAENDRIRKAWQQSCEQFYGIFHASANPIQGVAVIQDHRFVFCNDKFAEIMGYSVDELVSLPAGDMLALVHISDRALVKDGIRDRLAGKIIPKYSEFRGIRKDGTEIWLEIDSNLIEYDGKPAIRAIFMEITQRKKTGESLQRISDWHNAIFEGSRDAILISDSNSMMVDANAAALKLTGYSKEELLKMRGSDLNRELDLARFEILRNRILSGDDVLGEAAIISKDGRRLDVEFGHLRVMIAGEPYIYTIARDITVRKQLEAQLLQTQKMEAIGVLAGGIARDFNNLLSAIQGYTEMLMEDTDPHDPKYLDLEQIAKASRRGALLTSQMLTFSRNQILQSELLNLNDIVKNMDPMIRRLVGDNVVFTFANQQNLGFINADQGQIQQIIMNLTVNARDAMLHGGAFTIETANVELDDGYIGDHLAFRAGPHVMLAVSDNGIGMDEVTKSHIFEPFFTTKSGGEGTGLGLSAVYGIVKQNNGHIWVDSKPGEGTTFKIYFPHVS